MTHGLHGALEPAPSDRQRAEAAQDLALRRSQFPRASGGQVVSFNHRALPR